MRAGALAILLLGCHIVERNELVRPGTSERMVLRDKPVARRPTIQLTDAGLLRFVEPLECPTEITLQQLGGTETITKPNLATFVVGVVATSIGAIATLRGLGDSDPGDSPFTYAGLAMLGGGAAFAIGPWLGNRRDIAEGSPRPSVKTPGPTEPCGERPINARTATLRMRGIEVHGSISRDGLFSVSPYAIVDAFEVVSVPVWDVAAILDGETSRMITAIVDGGALSTHAKAFLASATFDTKIEPIRLVPGVVPSTLRVSLSTTLDSNSVRIVLPVRNDGPGPTWALRAHVTAPGTPAIDGRVLYIGSLAKGESRDGLIAIPISPDVSVALRNGTLDLFVELRDAHGTAPSAPIRYRGPVMVDPTR